MRGCPQTLQSGRTGTRTLGEFPHYELATRCFTTQPPFQVIRCFPEQLWFIHEMAKTQVAVTTQTPSKVASLMTMILMESFNFSATDNTWTLDSLLATSSPLPLQSCFRVGFIPTFHVVLTTLLALWIAPVLAFRMLMKLVQILRELALSAYLLH